MVYRTPVHQGVLEHTLQNLFPSQNVRKEIDIKHPKIATGYLEVDLWFPHLNIGFEFQDDYHYKEIWYSHVPLSKIQARDDVKKALLLKKGCTLINVPCWWRGDSHSLKAAIKFHRPDLLLNDNNEVKEGESGIIPFNPPIGFFDVNGLKVRGLMAASFATPYILRFSHSWWLGEKYDGVRCCWNPSERQLRRGNKINVPLSFFHHFPDQVAFDAELWSGRGQFSSTQALLLSSFANWSCFRMIWFDEASVRLNNTIFERRYDFLLQHLPTDCPINTIAPRLLCPNFLTMSQLLDFILKDTKREKEDCKGEGIILRKPHSFYEIGPNNSLFKIKSLTRVDQEALVTDVLSDGYLQLQLPNGTLFKAPIDKTEREMERVKRGDVVTFTYESHKRRPIPSNPLVTRIRRDFHWPLSSSLYFSSSPSLSFSSSPSLSSSLPQKGMGESKVERGRQKMRRFLEKVAKNIGLDPLVAENWYSIPRKQLMQFKELRTYTRTNSTSISKMLLNLFPTIGIDISKFNSTPRNYYKTVNNRRALFETFARDNGVNPLSTQFWYDLTPDRLRNTKGGISVMWYYGGYVESLIHLFPEINWDRTKFKTYTAGSWRKESSRREYFDNFAKWKGFDPLLPSNWYPIEYSDFKGIRGLAMVVRYHNNRLTQALMDLYPDIGLQERMFKR